MQTIKRLAGFLLLMTAGCSVQPRVDTAPIGATDPVTGVPPNGTPVYQTPACGYYGCAQPGGPTPVYGYGCDIDTRQVVEVPGHFFEIITSRGRLFEFENGMPIQAGVGFPIQYPSTPGEVDLTTIPLYAQGPCAGMPAGACVFDTQAFVRLPEGRFLEYVTVGGRQWVFENNQMTGAGVDLNAIPRYAPICALSYLTGGMCLFDTRTFYKVGAEVVESITAYGRKWELNIDAIPLSNTGMDLMAYPQYARGPCLGSAPGSCVFGTRTFEPINGQIVETVTVRGVVYRYLPNGAELPGSGQPIGADGHWTGVCR